MLEIRATALDSGTADRSAIVHGEISSLSWQGDGLLFNVSIRNTASTGSRAVELASSIDYFTGLSVGAAGRSLGHDSAGNFLARLCALGARTRAVPAGQASGHLANSTTAGLVPYYGHAAKSIASWPHSVGLNSPYPMQDEVCEGARVCV